MKKIISLLTAATMCLCMTACSFWQKTPTAEELIQNGIPVDKYISADMNLNFEADITSEDLGSMTMAMKMILETKVLGGPEAMMMDGSVSAEVLGMKMKEDMKSYVITEGDETTSYDYDSENDRWTYSISDKDDSNSTGLLDFKDYELEDIALEETTKDATEWVVNAKMNMSDNPMLSTMEMDGLIDDNSLSDMKINIVLTYDKKTNLLTSITMTVDGAEADGIEIIEFVLEVKNIEWTDDKVTVPTNVVRDAVPENDIDDSFGGFGDDEYSFDDNTDSSIEGGDYPESYSEFEMPEESEVSESTQEAEYTEVSEENIESTNTLDNVEIKLSSYQPEYGGTEIYILGVNTSDEDKMVEVSVDFYKSGEKIFTNSRYLRMQDDVFSIESLYVTDDFDDVKYTAKEVNTYDDFYLGKDIDVDYIINEDGNITGTITNNTQDTLSYPQVCFAVFDDNMNVIYYEDTYAEADTLSPGENTTFEIFVDSNITNASEVRIYVEAS